MSLEVGKCRDRLNALILKYQQGYRFAKTGEHLSKLQTTVGKLRELLATLDGAVNAKDIKKINDFCDALDEPASSPQADWLDFLHVQQGALKQLIMDGLAEAIYNGQIQHPYASKIKRVMDAKLQKTPPQAIAEIKKIMEA